MAWVKLDDGMPENLKIEGLSDAAFRAYVTSICYAARNLTDGFVTAKKAKEFAGKPRVIQELMPELWQALDGGYMIHDFLKYNPTRESVLKKREADSARKSGGIQTESARNPDGIQSDRARDPVPAPPDPVPEPLEEVSKKLFARANEIAVNPDLDVRDELPFVAQFRKRYQESKGEDPPRNQTADARAMERKYGAVVCIEIANDYDWGVSPSYLAKVLEGRSKANDQSNGTDQRLATTPKNPDRVADRVPKLDRLRAAVAERGREREQRESQGLRGVGT